METEDGRVISYRDYENERRTAIDGEYRTRYKTGYDLLLAEAKRIDALGQQRQPGQQPQQPEDPFTALQDDSIVDGRTAKQLLQHFASQVPKPVADLVRQLTGQVQALSKQVQGTSSHIGTFNEERATHEFESNLSKTLANVEIKGFNGQLDVNAPALREFARNLYLSYQPDSWRAGEFQKMLGDQLSSIVQYMRTADREYASGAPQRLRQNFNPAKGAGRPSGEKRYQFERPSDIVARARDMGMWGGGNRT